MAFFKCKMCGGELRVSEGITVCECEYCGAKQTVPLANDEKKVALFNRANRLRFNCEFDKASGVYESIVADFPEEAEAYWGLVLCKYGIEYVDDPATARKIPTCHRSSFESVMDDNNFEQVMENADVMARSVYRDEAKQIEELRKRIIEVSSKEEPYDLFICYKETDESGDRTIDSVIAQDVYDALIEKGYRVFFSRITLEDKLGQEYEPYIFAALNSAKIMLAFGTSYDYYNAVWVKNEWSRFLQLIVKGEKKVLIPCYKNIDAYDMPKEFAKLQAQDMGKVGAVQDLLRGVEKILPKKEKENSQASTLPINAFPQSASSNTLLKRAFMFLEDGEWKDANAYCEKVLDQEPENAQAYLGKLMAELQVRKQEWLLNVQTPFDDKNNYKKILRYGDSQLVVDIKYISETVRKKYEQRMEEERLKLEEEKRGRNEERQKLEAEQQWLIEEQNDVQNEISNYKKAVNERKTLESECFQKKAAIEEIHKKVRSLKYPLDNARDRWFEATNAIGKWRKLAISILLLNTLSLLSWWYGFWSGHIWIFHGLSGLLKITTYILGVILFHTIDSTGKKERRWVIHFDDDKMYYYSFIFGLICSLYGIIKSIIVLKTVKKWDNDAQEYYNRNIKEPTEEIHRYERDAEEAEKELNDMYAKLKQYKQNPIDDKLRDALSACDNIAHQREQVRQKLRELG